jgi:hypothetical protein
MLSENYTINAELNQVHTLYVNSYSLKYSKKSDNIVRVTIPNYSDEIDISSDETRHLSNHFKNDLLECGWTNQAINSLETKILFPEDGVWRYHMRKININSGKISKVYL